MSEQSFETKVLVDLAEIKGAISLVNQKTDTQGVVLGQHAVEINALKEAVAKVKGISMALSVLIPTIVSATVAVAVAAIWR